MSSKNSRLLNSGAQVPDDWPSSNEWKTKNIHEQKNNPIYIKNNKMLNPNSSQAYGITNARTKSSIIATSPKLTVVYASIPDEALTLTYQGIEYNPDTGEKQIARLNFSLTFDEVEKLANYVKQAKKDYAKQIAAEKKDSIERAKNEVRSAKTHVKWTEKQLTKIKNAS